MFLSASEAVFFGQNGTLFLSGGVAELVEGARFEIVYAGRLVSRVRTPAPPPDYFLGLVATAVVPWLFSFRAIKTATPKAIYTI